MKREAEGCSLAGGSGTRKESSEPTLLSPQRLFCRIQCHIASFLVLLSLAAATAFAQNGSLRSIRVVLDNNYPPFSFIDSSGQLAGISVDQWALWQKQTGIKAELYGADWGDALARMRAGEFDVIDTIFQIREREDYLTFTKPYVRIEVSIFFRRDIAGISGLNSLKGFPVAAKAGDAAVGLLRQSGIETILLFPSYEAIIKAAQERKVNVFIMDRPPALYLLNKFDLQDDFRETAPVNTGELHRAVRKEHSVLLKTVETGFAALDPAALKRVSENWYGKPLGGRPGLRYVGYAAITGLVLILGLTLWNVLLNRLVRARTSALQQSESRLRALLDHIPDWVWLKDTSSRYVTANTAYARAVNRSLDTLTGMTDEQLWPNNLARQFVNDDQAALKSGQTKRLLEEVTDARGKQRTMDTLKAPVRNAKGETLGTVGIARDITERTRADAELRRANRTLHMLTECNEAVVRASEQTELLQAICRLAVETGGYRMAWVGLAQSDPVRTVSPVAKAGHDAGYLDSAHVTWDDSERGHGPVGTAIRTGQPVVIRNTLTDPGFGPWRPAALERGFAAAAALPLKCTGAIVGAFAVYAGEPGTFDTGEVALLTQLADDIAYAITALKTRAEQQRTEEALRTSEKKFRSIFEDAPLGIFQSTPAGRLISVNRAGARMFGYDSPSSFLEASVDIPGRHFANPEERQEVIQEAVQANTFVCREIEYRRRDSSTFLANLFIHAVRGADGEVALIEGFVQDITEQKSAEQRLRQSHERAQALSARLQSLREDERTKLARELHDHLGQLLTALKLDIGMIERKIALVGDAQLSSVFSKKAESARTITDEVIASVQKIASELRPGVLDRLGLAAAIESEAEKFESRTGVKFQLQLPENSLVLPQDQSTCVFRIFQELLTNIARHAKATQVSVSLGLKDCDLVLEAQDNGVGIRQADVDDPRSLGVAGMQERAKILGGQTIFQPAPGGGTRVVVTLPIQRKDQVPE
jgi:PAS domain S-box-containing protein